MKTFDQISNQVHDASGLVSLPNNYMWEQKNSVWYPVGEILDLIKVNFEGSDFTVEVGDIQFSGKIHHMGSERSYRWEVEMDWFLNQESEDFYDNNWELINQIIYERQ
jgi:hypothetical protein